MRKYEVACSGWLTVEVKANSPEEAKKIVEETTPGASGELYDMEIDDVTEVGLDKLPLLQEELKGLPVEWKSHHGDGVIDMARVNNHTIIWHENAFCSPSLPEVEVYFAGGDDPDGHVPIKGLKEKVKEVI